MYACIHTTHLIQEKHNSKKYQVGINDRVMFK